MEKVFVQLYPMVALLSVGGYIPQIVKLARAKLAGEDGIALGGWLLWIATNIISLGYAIFHLKDFMFALTVGASLAAMIVVVGLVVYRRYILPRMQPLAPAEPL